MKFIKQIFVTFATCTLAFTFSALNFFSFGKIPFPIWIFDFYDYTLGLFE